MKNELFFRFRENYILRKGKVKKFRERLEKAKYWFLKYLFLFEQWSKLFSWAQYPLDMFAIQVCQLETNKKIGHLPMKILEFKFHVK